MFVSSFEKLVEDMDNIGIAEEREIYEIVQSENFGTVLNASWQGLILMICFRRK